MLIDQEEQLSEDEDLEVDFCDDIPLLQERISSLKQKLLLYKQAVAGLQQENQAEDNIYYIY